MARRSGLAARAGTWLAIGLLAFVGTAVIVIWRRTRGVGEETRIAELEAQRRDLDAQRVSLERDLRTAMSASRIEPAAARRLGLRMPSDSQIVTLVRARAAAASADTSPSDRP
jgi:cell division protein FtsL